MVRVCKLIPLLEACDFTMGQSPSSDTYNTIQDGMPFYQGNADFGKRSPAPRVWCSAPKKTANEGDILISVRAPIGAINIASERCCIGRGLAAIEPMPNVVTRDYLEHYLRFRKPELERRGTGSTFKAVGKKAFEEMTLPIVPMEEQTGIARRLSGVVELKESALSLIEELDDLVKSRFVEMLGDPETNPMGWETYSIGQLATDVRYGTSKPASPDGEYKYIRMNNMTYEGGLDLSDTKRITLEGKELDNALVRHGDLLFNRTNSRDKVGKTCVFKFDEPMVIAGYIIRVRLCDSIEADYLATYLNTSHSKRMLREMAHGAVNQANINAKEMQSIVVPVPPVELQRDFLAFVRQVDKLKFETQQAIDKLQLLYDSLAQQYFAVE